MYLINILLIRFVVIFLQFKLLTYCFQTATSLAMTYAWKTASAINVAKHYYFSFQNVTGKWQKPANMVAWNTLSDVVLRPLRPIPSAEWANHWESVSQTFSVVFNYSIANSTNIVAHKSATASNMWLASQYNRQLGHQYNYGHPHLSTDPLSSAQPQALS